MEEIKEKEATTTPASSVPLKRLVSWVKSTILPELLAGSLFILYWIVCGAYADAKHFISSPAYWMAFGFFVGVSGIWITNKIKEKLFKY